MIEARRTLDPSVRGAVLERGVGGALRDRGLRRVPHLVEDLDERPGRNAGRAGDASALLVDGVDDPAAPTASSPRSRRGSRPSVCSSQPALQMIWGGCSTALMSMNPVSSTSGARRARVQRSRPARELLPAVARETRRTEAAASPGWMFTDGRARSSGTRSVRVLDLAGADVGPPGEPVDLVGEEQPAAHVARVEEDARCPPEARSPSRSAKNGWAEIGTVSMTRSAPATASARSSVITGSSTNPSPAAPMPLQAAPLDEGLEPRARAG